MKLDLLRAAQIGITSFSMFACGMSLSLIWKGRPFLNRKHLMIPLWSLFCLATGLFSIAVGWDPILVIPGFILMEGCALFLLNPHDRALNLTVLGLRIAGEGIAWICLMGFCLLYAGAGEGLFLMVLYTFGQTINFLEINVYVLHVLKKQNRTSLLWFLKTIQAASIFIGLILALYSLYMTLKREPIPEFAAALCVLSFFLILSASILFVVQKKGYDSLLNLMHLEQEAQAHEEYEQILLEDQKELDDVRRRCLKAASASLEDLKNGKTEQAQETMNRLQEDFRKEKMLVLTPIPALNAILSQKYAECVQAGIEIRGEYSFSVSGDEIILDLCIILGNLLDNAIRAVRILPEEQRRITLQIQKEKGCLFIRTSNPWDAEKALQIRQSGFGQRILGRMAERYNGVFRTTENPQGEYEAALMLFPAKNPAKEKKTKTKKARSERFFPEKSL